MFKDSSGKYYQRNQGKASEGARDGYEISLDIEIQEYGQERYNNLWKDKKQS